MKRLKLVFLILFGPVAASCQNIDSLDALLKQHSSPDTTRVKILTELAFELRGDDIVRGKALAQEALGLSQRLNFKQGEIMALVGLAHSSIRAGDAHSASLSGQEAVKLALQSGNSYSRANALWTLGYIYFRQGDYLKAIELLRQSQEANKEIDLRAAAITLQLLGRSYENIGDYSSSLKYALQSLEVSKQANYKSAVSFSLCTIGNTYTLLGDYTQALNYQNEALEEARSAKVKRAESFVLNSLGETYKFQGDYEKAIENYQQAIKLASETRDLSDQLINEGNLAQVYDRMKNYPLAFQYAKHVLTSSADSADRCLMQITIANIYFHTGNSDSAIYYGLKGLAAAQKIGRKRYSRDASQVMSEIYVSRGDYANGYHYQLLSSIYKDSIASDQAARRAALVQYQAELEKKQSQIELLSKNNELQREGVRRQKQLLFVSLGGVALLLILAGMLIRSNRQKQRTNAVLQQQKKEIQVTLTELKSTQAQLIQSEKMASLGELTAGIAHEIQNPLNFVNNFSDVNGELIGELVDEVDRGNTEEVKVIAHDIKQNLEKINHHGKRADAIVKGMLQHSRTSTGQKELTDINKLTDEYLRLAYHGMRARDKSFNAEIKTEFDNSLGKINIIPQDIGRVLLNLINNAFYAVNEKQKQNLNSYEPTVTVSTAKQNGKVEIKVKDNGKGIPQKIVDKIFQPFFTTKPTGQGTGLGLSLAYDIVKAHGGKIIVKTKEGEGSEFVVYLPSNSKILF